MVVLDASAVAAAAARPGAGALDVLDHVADVDEIVRQAR
jgi:hypothetical protein